MDDIIIRDLPTYSLDDFAKRFEKLIRGQREHRETSIDPVSSAMLTAADLQNVFAAAEFIQAKAATYGPLRNVSRDCKVALPQTSLPVHIPGVDWANTSFVFAGFTGTEEAFMRFELNGTALIQINGITMGGSLGVQKALDQRHPVLVHEMTHLFQYWKDPKRFQELKQRIIGRKEKVGLAEYFNFPWEIEAFTSTVVESYQRIDANRSPVEKQLFAAKSAAALRTAVLIEYGSNPFIHEAWGVIENQLWPTSLQLSNNLVNSWLQMRNQPDERAITAQAA